MKTLKYITQILFAGLLVFSSGCDQEQISLQDPDTPTPEPACPEGASAGSADFSKFVAIGNSFVAGFQGGALFTEGQNNSLPLILKKQFECITPSTFNQPDIGSVNGFNIQLSVPPSLILGRMILFDPDGTGPRSAGPAPSAMPATSATCPAAVSTPAVPAPYNTADAPSAYLGNKAELNNFGVPLIYLGQALIPQTGGPPTSNPYYNPLYARFASNPGTSTILGDALAAAGSFYLIWLGFDDVLLYAATGADGSYPLTDATAFDDNYHAAINTMLVANPLFKGVVGNIPDFTSLPYFFTIRWNQIELDQTKATALNTNLSENYNAFLDYAFSQDWIDADERDKRKLNYVAGKNPILISDENLTDMTPYMAGPFAGLAPYALARPATSTDIIPLSAGSVLGKCYNDDANSLWGVSVPLTDTHVLTIEEIQLILTRTAAFNETISSAVGGSDSRLVLADVRTSYSSLVSSQVALSNGVTVTPTFAPPTGIYSEDGLHPNSRGYAFTANVFIDAINTGFGASIPKANIGAYKGTPLPVSP